MGNIKKSLLVIALGMIMVTMGGCAYSNNKGWDELTTEEKQNVQQAFEDIKNDLEEDFSGDSTEDEFARYILDRVGKVIEDETNN